MLDGLLILLWLVGAALAFFGVCMMIFGVAGPFTFGPSALLVLPAGAVVFVSGVALGNWAMSKVLGY